MDIEQQYEEAEEKFQKKEFERLKRDCRLFIVGGYDGLEIMYYNYFQIVEKIKFQDIIPFETFIHQGDVNDLFLDKIFFEIDNKYLTNIGGFIYSLASQYVHSNDTIEIKKTNLISIINRLEEAIEKSHICELLENPLLFDILKKIENYYRKIYSELFRDFHPFLSDRPENLKLGNDNRFIFKLPKETVPLKVGILFHTGRIKIITGQTTMGKFTFDNVVYPNGNTLAKHLSVRLKGKVRSINTYLNSTYNKTHDDKNVFYSPKLRKEILEYCALNNVQIATNKVLNASE